MGKNIDETTGSIISVLTQKQDWGGLSRSWQLPGFVCWHYTLKRFSPSSRGWLCSFFYLRSTFSFHRDNRAVPPRSEMDSSSRFIPFPFCLCQRIKGKQEDKRFTDSREQREKSLCVAPFTLAVRVLGLHLVMKLNLVMSGPFWKFLSNIRIWTNMDDISTIHVFFISGGCLNIYYDTEITLDLFGLCPFLCWFLYSWNFL